MIFLEKTKYFIVALFAFIAQDSFGQCPTPSGTCDFTISGADAGTYTLNAGDTLCLTSTANFTGLARFRGGVLINCASATQTFTAAFQTNGSEFFNHGTWTNTGVVYDKDVIVHNYGTINNNGASTYNTDMTLNN